MPLQAKQTFYVAGAANNDLCQLLRQEGMKVVNCQSVSDALHKAPKGGAVLLLSDVYPKVEHPLTAEQQQTITRRRLHVYSEYRPSTADASLSPRQLDLERVVVADGSFCQELPAMSLLTINCAYVLPSQEVEKPLLVVAKVAGFDTAEYGLTDTPSMPLLYKDGNVIVATSALSRFATARFMPEHRWKMVWEAILSELTGKDIKLETWISYVHPMFAEHQTLPSDARRRSIELGVEWFDKGHFLVDPSWASDKPWLLKHHTEQEKNTIQAALPDSAKSGDGSYGMLPGHFSRINYDGQQQYDYTLRADIHGEAAMAYTLAGQLLGHQEWYKPAGKLLDFTFAANRKLTGDDPESAVYGLLNWIPLRPSNFYSDDNARFLLGAMATAAVQGDNRWNRPILECIMGNFRTSGKNGFRKNSLSPNQLLKDGWRHFYNRDLVNPHPHYESWIWCTYLFLYHKTQYQPLFDRAEKAIRLTMEAYKKGQWKWTNGLQQEKARMLLPLSWLVRVSPTEEHKQWLDFMVSEFLKNQQPCGAIMEELGDPSKGSYGKVRSNAEYGLKEAPLIAENGDPVADMLYTTNFAFIGLNEAARVTGNSEYLRALQKMSDFLTRIQVRSERIRNLDGAWFRAFNYRNWDYWASNADVGWGAQSTLTGWIQSWIVATQVLLEQNTSLWEVIEPLDVSGEWPVVKKEMLAELADKTE